MLLYSNRTNKSQSTRSILVHTGTHRLYLHIKLKHTDNTTKHLGPKRENKIVLWYKVQVLLDIIDTQLPIANILWGNVLFSTLESTPCCVKIQRQAIDISIIDWSCQRIAGVYSCVIRGESVISSGREAVHHVRDQVLECTWSAAITCRWRQLTYFFLHVEVSIVGRPYMKVGNVIVAYLDFSAYLSKEV